MKMTVEVQGLRELNAALRQLPQKVEKRVLDAALKAGAAPIAADASRRAPVLQEPDPRRKPGTVRDAVKATSRRETEGHSALVVVKPRRLTRAQISLFKAKSGQSGANNPEDPWYWWFIEFGTRFQAARPFLRPAFEARKNEAVRLIHERLGRRLRTAWEKLGFRRR